MNEQFSLADIFNCRNKRTMRLAAKFNWSVQLIWNNWNKEIVFILNYNQELKITAFLVYGGDNFTKRAIFETTWELANNKEPTGQRNFVIVFISLQGTHSLQKDFVRMRINTLKKQNFVEPKYNELIRYLIGSTDIKHFKYTFPSVVGTLLEKQVRKADICKKKR